jgi:hypothetical protein
MIMMTLLAALWAGTPEWEISLDDLELASGYNSYVNNALMDVSSDGVIGVMDRKGRQLVLLGPDGELLVRAGRKGRGPREFQRMEGVTWEPEANAFFVADRSNMRVTMWREDGSFVDGRGVKEVLRQMVGFDAGKVLYAKDTGGYKDTEPRISVYDLYKNDAIDLWKMAPLEESSGYHRISDAGHETLNMDWDPRLLFDTGSKIAVCTYNRGEKFWILDLGTWSVKDSFEVELPGVPLTDEYYDFILDPFPTGERREVEDKNPRPEFWPKSAKVLVDSADRIWIILFQRDPFSRADYVVVDSAGTKLGEGELPGNPQVIAGGFAYVVRLDDQGNLTLAKVPVSI